MIQAKETKEMEIRDQKTESIKPEGVVCPVCGGVATEDAVFCGNPVCGKALGPFKYALEEFPTTLKWYERFADRITDFIGKPHFLVVHFVWFLAWVVLNTGAMMWLKKPFDEYPFGLLGLVVGVEAIFITGLLLISQNRQSAFADQRAELDYEVSVRIYREIHATNALLRDLQARLDALEKSKPLQ